MYIFFLFERGTEGTSFPHSLLRTTHKKRKQHANPSLPAPFFPRRAARSLTFQPRRRSHHWEKQALAKSFLVGVGGGVGLGFRV